MTPLISAINHPKFIVSNQIDKFISIKRISYDIIGKSENNRSYCVNNKRKFSFAQMKGGLILFSMKVEMV